MCLSPLIIKVDVAGGATRTYTVPCGKCLECLKTRQNDYMVRIYEELMQAGKGCFLTLTYSNQSVPYFERDGKKYLTVWKPDVRDWLKRFRTNYGRATGKKGIRFFLCSEYGPHTHRPHYHCLFFGLSCKDAELAINDWRDRFGFVMAKDLSPDSVSFERSARYVSKYSCKGILEDPFREAVRLASRLPELFEGSRQYIHPADALIPYFFICAYFNEKKNFNRLLSPWKYKDLRCGIFGRGVEEEVCNYQRLHVSYA